MEHISKTIQQLATTFPLIAPDEQEPWLLTQEEESQVMESFIRNNYRRFINTEKANLTDEELQKRVGSYDWQSVMQQEGVLQRANSLKNQEEWHRQQRRKEKQEAIDKRKAIEEKWTASEMYKFIQRVSYSEYNRKLIYNNDTQPLIKAICYLLSNDSRYKTEMGFDSEKGLILRGAFGLGKSHIAICAAKNERNPISIYSMLEITDAVRDNGGFDIPVDSKMLYLDDVGTEQPMVNNYGTKILWFKEFLEIYYSKKKFFNRLIISTNCNFTQLEEMYGSRVRSRMKEMFNILDVKGKDLRS